MVKILRTFSWIFWSMLIIGLQFRIMHWAGSGPMLIFSLSGILFISIIRFFYLLDKDFALGLLHLSLGWQSFYWLFRLMFWEGAFMLNMLATLSILGFFAYVGVKSIAWRSKFTAFTISSVCTVILSFTSAHHIYYAFNFSFLNSEQPDKFAEMDKYSWFLYLADEKDKALISNAKAIKMLSKTSDYPKDSLTKILGENQRMIKDHTWIRYVRLE